MLSERADDWLDRNSGRLFILPAVLLILAFSLFPLIISAWLALSRFKLVAGGFSIRYIGVLNFKKMITGSQQFHLLGTFAGALSGPDREEGEHRQARRDRIHGRHLVVRQL